MLGLLLFGLMASALAAPQYNLPGQHGHFGPLIPFPDYRTIPVPYNNQWPFTANVFDSNKFNNELSNYMRQVNEMVADVNRRFAPQVVGNEYKITLNLPGFEKEDITVQAREGMVSIQASHRQSSTSGWNNYANFINLPDAVKPNCTWFYDNSVLKIVCPLKDWATTEQPEKEKEAGTTLL